MPPTTARKPGLNADARALLLEAVIPTDELPAAFIILRGDVRGAQFRRGEERLRQIGLLDGDTYNLTDEGITAARELKENDARLISGIRYDEREAAIRMRGGKETANIPDEWQRCELDGQPAFTNGYILILGYKPSDKLPAKTFAPERIQAAWDAGGADAPRLVTPVAYSEQQGWKERKRTVWLSDGACVDAEAFNFVMQRAPGATITHEATPNADRYSQRKVLNFYVDGHRVAMLMPYQLDAPAGVAAVLESVRGDHQETADRCPKPSRRTLQGVGRALYFSINQRIDAPESDYRFYLCKDALAAAVAPVTDMLTVLWDKPEQCLTWLLMCWQGLAEEVKACTGRTRAEWLRMIEEAKQEDEQADQQPQPQAPAPHRAFESARAQQLPFTFDLAA